MGKPKMLGMPSKPIQSKERKEHHFGPKPVVDNKALGRLLANKNKLTRQQYKTIKGQILAGDAEGAMRGLEKLTKKRTTKTVSICEGVTK